MSAIPETSRWIDFFRTYRQLPALWKVTDEVYKNKRIKQLSYDKLLACYQRIHPHANVDGMRRRMNGIRTCYRREMRKVEQSELNAKSGEDIYVPHLWYFNELSFLRVHDDKTANNVTNAAEMSDGFWHEADDDNAETPTDEFMEATDEIEEIETKFQPAETQEAVTKQNETPESLTNQSCAESSISQSMAQSQFLPQLSESFNHSDRDEAAIYAEGWATSYRKLDAKNKLLAKKAIEEILILGQLSQLEFNSVKMPK